MLRRLWSINQATRGHTVDEGNRSLAITGSKKKDTGDFSRSSRGLGVKSRMLGVIEHHIAKTERRDGAPRDREGKHHSKKHESGCGLHANHITYIPVHYKTIDPVIKLVIDGI